MGGDKSLTKKEEIRGGMLKREDRRPPKDEKEWCE